jgi:endoglucanase
VHVKIGRRALGKTRVNLSRAFKKVQWALLLASALGLASGAAGASNSFLRARGHDMVNEQGERILLRGVGLGNWMLPEGYMWKFGKNADRPRRIEKLVSDLIGEEEAARFWSEFRREYITEADIQRIAALGFNSVRPALNARLFLTETEPAQFRPEGFELLDNLIRWSREQGLYVIIDMHGAPGGQTGQNIDDSLNDEPRLFMETLYQDQLVALWEEIARRYKGEPAVAGYDLLNEPLPERTGAARKYKAQLEPLYQRLTRAIRAIDPKHMIVLEGADWSNDWSVFTKPFDSNLVYQFHYYCWDQPTRVNSIQKFLDYRERFNVPVWVGETGEKDNTIYWATTEYFEANNIGWAFWPWKKMDTRNTPYSIPLPTGWQEIVAYSDGGPKPSAEVSRKAFAELLTNIRLNNCVFFPDVVNSMLRRAPVRIEAENFGREGQGRSFQVNATNGPSPFYRLTEPVPVIQLASGRRYSDQFISLKAGEWTAYGLAGETPGRFRITARARSTGGVAEVEIAAGGQVFALQLNNGAWQEMDAGILQLNGNRQRLVWTVRKGTADLDWIRVDRAGAVQETAVANPPALVR